MLKRVFAERRRLGNPGEDSRRLELAQSFEFH
jgi:hypothetical protein